MKCPLRPAMAVLLFWGVLVFGQSTSPPSEPKAEPPASSSDQQQKSPLLNCAFLATALQSGLGCGAAPDWIQDAVGTGISAGAKAPGFELPDQSGRKRSLASLMGQHGLVLVFFRSADW